MEKFIVVIYVHRDNAQKNAFRFQTHYLHLYKNFIKYKLFTS